jgi:hypothetical protein
MLADDPVWTTRAAFRDALIVKLRQRAKELAQPIEGGALDGIEVLSLGILESALQELAADPLPPASETRAEVRTPATLVVSAMCPKCDLPAGIVLAITSRLEVDDEGSELKLRAKAKARTHFCGQLSLLEAPIADGQEELPVDDEEAEPAAEAEAEGCPFPGCVRPAEHRGKHDVPAPMPESAADDGTDLPRPRVVH